MPASRPTTLFFDVNETLLDLQPVKDSVTDALGGRRELVPVWFTTLLQYSLVATVSEHYAGFGDIAAAALRLVARQHDLDLDPDAAEQALEPIRHLPPHPDVAPALTRLRAAGYRLYTLTNSAPDALRAQMDHAGLTDLFDGLLSVDATMRFKPHPDTYAYALAQAGSAPAESLLVAAHGWDIAGAGWAGLQTAFVARPGHALYPLAATPTHEVADLHVLADRLCPA